MNNKKEESSQTLPVSVIPKTDIAPDINLSDLITQLKLTFEQKPRSLPQQAAPQTEDDHQIQNIQEYLAENDTPHDHKTSVAPETPEKLLAQQKRDLKTQVKTLPKHERKQAEKTVGMLIALEQATLKQWDTLIKMIQKDNRTVKRSLAEQLEQAGIAEASSLMTFFRHTEAAKLHSIHVEMTEANKKDISDLDSVTGKRL
ncbi:MAG: type VI secretion system contractile sheath protein TssC [Deltaproteobacteria bacterium]|nr:type VI secretion system contractile sheath protein TssC [Deltaproteobacteria bacterium]